MRYATLQMEDVQALKIDFSPKLEKCGNFIATLLKKMNLFINFSFNKLSWLVGGQTKIRNLTKNDQS